MNTRKVQLDSDWMIEAKDDLQEQVYDALDPIIGLIADQDNSELCLAVDQVTELVTKYESKTKVHCKKCGKTFLLGGEISDAKG